MNLVSATVWFRKENQQPGGRAVPNGILPTVSFMVSMGWSAATVFNLFGRSILIQLRRKKRLFLQRLSPKSHYSIGKGLAFSLYQNECDQIIPTLSVLLAFQSVRLRSNSAEIKNHGIRCDCYRDRIRRHHSRRATGCSRQKGVAAGTGDVLSFA